MSNTFSFFSKALRGFIFVYHPSCCGLVAEEFAWEGSDLAKVVTGLAPAARVWGVGGKIIQRLHIDNYKDKGKVRYKDNLANIVTSLPVWGRLENNLGPSQWQWKRQFGNSCHKISACLCVRGADHWGYLSHKHTMLQEGAGSLLTASPNHIWYSSNWNGADRLSWCFWNLVE